MAHGTPPLLVSFVLATHNRRDVVLRTLSRLNECGLPRREFEVLVVDNASSDGTPSAIEPHVDAVIRLHVNEGSCAKARAAAQANGRYIVFLDDDSHPRAGSVERMLRRFDADPLLAAAGFHVHLPDGTEECAALPGVYVGCGVGLRPEALRAVGGLDRSFFMQAEEYDLCFRMAATGWRVGVFDDLHVEHEKTSVARRSGRTAYHDIRNNLRVLARYLPQPYLSVYQRDLIQRYQWLARLDGHQRAFRRGRLAGWWRGAWERRAFRRFRLPGTALEAFYRWREILDHFQQIRREGVRKVVLAGLGKNIYPFHRAACLTGMEVAAIADDRFEPLHESYRGSRVETLVSALSNGPDAVVVSDCAPVHAARTARKVANLFQGPVHDWFGQAENKSTPGKHCPTPRAASDETIEPARRSPALAIGHAAD